MVLPTTIALYWPFEATIVGIPIFYWFIMCWKKEEYTFLYTYKIEFLTSTFAGKFNPHIICAIFNRPSEAGAVLQTLPLLNKITDWSFVKIYSTNLHSQTVGAREQTCWEKVSRVTCHMSRVTCHLSHVITCHMSHVICHNLFFKQRGEASQRRVCYQRGLPCLVSKVFLQQKWT